MPIPVQVTHSAPSLTGLYDLKLRMSESATLTRVLLDAGVNKKDAQVAGQAIADRISGQPGGCTIKVSLSRSSEGAELTIQRLVLVRASGNTVFERRGGLLTVVPGSPKQSAVPIA